MTPEQRQQMERWAQERAREGGGSADATNTPATSTETLDLRREATDQRVVGEVDNPRSIPSDAEARLSRRAMADEVRQAVDSAQSGADQRDVPRERARAVDRYFRKTLERLAPPAPDAPEAPAKDAAG